MNFNVPPNAAIRRQGGGGLPDMNLLLSGQPGNPNYPQEPQSPQQPNNPQQPNYPQRPNYPQDPNYPRQPTYTRKRCCPYDFDSNFCKTVDDRVLCGYNKNLGTPQSKNQMFELTENCRIRGGRLECGYEKGPFTNIRRPPARDGFFPSNNNDQYGSSYYGTTLRSSDSVTRCVEINERIICTKI
ncbi:hypothetical protein HF086_008920 [Spodoptera exigua]|uniref:Uncharacterized protein n=1 Tax=Spodoptera exigua TaxID=7107 RepID=A0A922MUC2_SPOEX|nr:hypothetical protein HF086_008920 [Spodoptera exigua]